MNTLSLRYGFIDELSNSNLIKECTRTSSGGYIDYNIVPRNYDEETLEQIDCLFSSLLCTYEADFDFNTDRVDYIIK